MNELPADRAENSDYLFAHYTWLVNGCEVLNSNANEYAKSLINNNITSKKRLCKKIKQFGTCYLQQQLQFLEDDAESVLESLGLLKDTAAGSQGTGDQQDVIASVIDQDVVEKEDMTSSVACATPPQGSLINTDPDDFVTGDTTNTDVDTSSTQQSTKKRKRITGPEIDSEHELEIKKKIKTQLLENGINLSTLIYLEISAVPYKEFLLSNGWTHRKGTGLVTFVFTPPGSLLKLSHGDLMCYFRECLLTTTDQNENSGEHQNIAHLEDSAMADTIHRLHEAQIKVLDYIHHQSHDVSVEIERTEIKKGLTTDHGNVVQNALLLLVKKGFLKERLQGRKAYYSLTVWELSP